MVKLPGFTIDIFACGGSKIAYYRSPACILYKSVLVFFYGLSLVNVVLGEILNGAWLENFKSDIPSRNSCREILTLLALNIINID